MELTELQRLCQKFGLMEDQYESPFLVEIVKKHAMVSRLKKYISFNQELRYDTEDDDTTDKMGEDENGENHFICM